MARFSFEIDRILWKYLDRVQVWFYTFYVLRLSVFPDKGLGSWVKKTCWICAMRSIRCWL